MILAILLSIYIVSIMVSFICHIGAFLHVRKEMKKISSLSVRSRLNKINRNTTIKLSLLSFVPIFNTWVALCYLKSHSIFNSNGR